MPEETKGVPTIIEWAIAGVIIIIICWYGMMWTVEQFRYGYSGNCGVIDSCWVGRDKSTYECDREYYKNNVWDGGYLPRYDIPHFEGIC